jgi:hypothetical protein
MVSKRSSSAANWVRSKLGVCPRCMRLALALSALAWALLIVFPSAPLFVAAIICTVPASAHLVAFGIRRSVGRPVVSRSSGCCGDSDARVTRQTLLKGLGVVLLGLWGAGTARVQRAQAQIGRTVTVEVKDQNGKVCAGVTVVLADPCQFVPATTHRRPMCVSVNRRHTPTSQHGRATFDRVLPGQYEVCICGGYDCVLNATTTGCVVKCKGPTRRITVPPDPAPVPTEAFVLVDCKC